jgi:hypothetical protein
MSTVKAYYDGSAFVPFEPVHMPKGKVVSLSILSEEAVSPRAAERLAAFRQLRKEIHELNQEEPFPPEFDEIMKTRMNFARELDL